jgi:broad specificity phosphatase PhoE
MSILLVRHGETPSNRERIMQLEGTPLSTLGQQQAELLAQRLCTLGVAQILCSDLARARMTAAPLALRSGAELVLSPLLRERDFGDLRGTPYSALACDPFAPDFVPPGGESWEVFHARVAEAFALISAARRSTDGNLVVITHGLVLRAILQRHVSWPQAAGELPNPLANTSVTLLAGTAPHAPSLINCCAHLGEQARGTQLGGAV